MTGFTDLHARIDAMCTRASGGEADPALITDMEDLLSEGYVRALAAEATSRRLERRLDELLGAVNDDTDKEARRLAVERRTVGEMEDLLSEVYVRALAGEATSRRLERRLDELLGTVGEDDAAREACRLAVERRTIQGRVDELRLQLLAVRQTFVGLGGGRIGAR